MAFMLHYKCEFCGYEIWSTTRPSEWDCPCYIPESKDTDTTINNPMPKQERKERYRIQYKLNGYSWNNQKPTMYIGELPHELD